MFELYSETEHSVFLLLSSWDGIVICNGSKPARIRQAQGSFKLDNVANYEGHGPSWNFKPNLCCENKSEWGKNWRTLNLHLKFPKHEIHTVWIDILNFHKYIISHHKKGYHFPLPFYFANDRLFCNPSFFWSQEVGCRLFEFGTIHSQSSGFCCYSRSS